MEQRKDGKVCYEDEIDLYELLLILKRKLKIIVFLTFIGTSLGLLIAFLSPNIYLATAKLNVEVNSPELIKISINEAMKNAENMVNKPAFILPINNNNNNNNNNIVTVLNSYSFKLKVCQKLKEDLLKSPSRIDIKCDDDYVNKFFSAEIDNKTGIINMKSEQKDRLLAKRILEISLAELKKEIKRISLSSFKNENVLNLVVLEDPVYMDNPIKPKRLLIIIVSFISSLMLGVFSAFLMEWFENVRKQK
ncbi:MAG: Wzz/FepE/Etk N-terminal domain-containing protein [Hydrogenothermaceae bacterium]